MSAGQDRLREWIWAGDDATGDAMALIEAIAFAAARTCCGHRMLCEHARPRDKARSIRDMGHRRAYAKAMRELRAAAQEVVMFWAKSETAAAASMERDVLRLSQALDALYEIDHTRHYS